MSAEPTPKHPPLSEQIKAFIESEGEIIGEDGNGRPTYGISLAQLLAWQELAKANQPT